MQHDNAKSWPYISSVSHQTPTLKEREAAMAPIKMNSQKLADKKSISEFWSAFSAGGGGGNRTESLPMMGSIAWPIGKHNWKLN